MEFCFRCFVEVDSEASAAQIKEELKDLLKSLGTLRSEVVKPYWKIKEYFEIFLSYPFSETESFKNLMTSLGSGWEELSDKEAIWKPIEVAKFSNEKVKWAHIEVVE